MNKIISIAFLAIFVFYGFRRCSKPHPGESRDRSPASSPVSSPASEPVGPGTAGH